MFAELPHDIQREIIDWCIKENTLEIFHEEQLYKLPTLIQITYYCEKDAVSYPTRIYAIDLIQDVSHSKKIKCKLCYNWIYITNKSAVTLHIISGKAKKDLSGVRKFITS